MEDVLMRLIDADALRADYLTKYDTDEFAFDNCYPWWQFSKAIADAPTVDAVPVIRCRDCNNRECEGREGLIVCGIDGTSHTKDWFCADGERRSTNA
jgi:hypothetical protein